jgi:hypothetical protein
MNNIQIETSTFLAPLQPVPSMCPMLYINLIYSHVSGAILTPNALNTENRMEVITYPSLRKNRPRVARSNLERIPGCTI